MESVREFRLASKRPVTRELANYPTNFAFVSQPNDDYLAVPSVSSERRSYIPIGFFGPEVIASNLCLIIPNAGRYHFGVRSSAMHMAWVRYVAGRLESRYRYSNQIVYNNFPWPQDVGDKQKATVEKAAQGVLDARQQFPNASLADLYDPVSMPPGLREAHSALDKAVDAAYGKKGLNLDAERVAFLFDLYQQYTTLLPHTERPKRTRRQNS